MAIRRFFLVFGVSLSLSTSAIARVPTAAATLTDEVKLQTPAVLVAQSLPRRLLRAPLRIVTSISPALLLASLSLAGGAFIALAWLHIYQQQRRWQRVELARQEVKAFRERESVRNVLDILDYEEYRTFYINHPKDGRLISFEATDCRLRRALRSHDQMVKMRNGLDEIKRLISQNNAITPKTLELVPRYDSEEFVIEITLRDWFQSFLGGLEHF